ncbi:MAG TPA: hypothetical protein VFM68_00615 [Candidatus Saccharimonadales bacterium]|nr:hypothetical protein [Candidatus Saccharimonadales bacterium]
MNKVTQSSIELLQQPQNASVLSIYLPTHRYPTPPHMQEDQIRFKNLIRKARDEWQKNSNDHAVDDIYKQLEAKLDDLDFWQQATEGTAVFASPDHIETYHLPIECEERVYVGDSYDITPLRIIMTLDQPYYLIALAMHNTKLLRGDIYGLEPVAIEFPTSPEDALNIDEMFSNSRTVRSREGPSGADNAISPHGQGDSSEAGREERLQYFRIIDGIIADSAVIDQTLPVLIAGTDSEAGDYKNISKLPTLLSTYLQGNHTTTPLQGLHAQAWQIIHNEVVNKKTATAVEQFQELRGVEKSSRDIQHITESADAGRIGTLLVTMLRMTTDSVSDTVHTAVPIITFTENYEHGHIIELVQKVAAQGGRILGLNYDSMPEKVPVAAIYRY